MTNFPFQPFQFVGLSLQQPASPRIVAGPGPATQHGGLAIVVIQNLAKPLRPPGKQGQIGGIKVE